MDVFVPWNKVQCVWIQIRPECLLKVASLRWIGGIPSKAMIVARMGDPPPPIDWDRPSWLSLEKRHSGKVGSECEQIQIHTIPNTRLAHSGKVFFDFWTKFKECPNKEIRELSPFGENFMLWTSYICRYFQPLRSDDDDVDLAIVPAWDFVVLKWPVSCCAAVIYHRLPVLISKKGVNFTPPARYSRPGLDHKRG